jgi:hypothetical protein
MGSVQTGCHTSDVLRSGRFVDEDSEVGKPSIVNLVPICFVYPYRPGGSCARCKACWAEVERAFRLFCSHVCFRSRAQMSGDVDSFLRLVLVKESTVHSALPLPYVPSVLPLLVARLLIPHRTLFFKAKDLVCIVEKRLRDCAGRRAGCSSYVFISKKDHGFLLYEFCVKSSVRCMYCRVGHRFIGLRCLKRARHVE